MRYEIDINNWKRKKSYETFSKFDDPYTGVVTKIDVTNLVSLKEKTNQSFYGTMLYFILFTMNQLEQFKYGYGKHNGETLVYRFDEIAVTATMLQENGILNFTRYIKFSNDYFKFIENFNEAKHDAEVGVDYYKIKNLDDMNKVHATCLPWIKFSNFKDAINYSEKSSKPKVCWGKYYLEHDRYYIDFSILVNHAFQDGYDIAKFITNLQENIHNFDYSLLITGVKKYEKKI